MEATIQFLRSNNVYIQNIRSIHEKHKILKMLKMLRVLRVLGILERGREGERHRVRAQTAGQSRIFKKEKEREGEREREKRLPRARTSRPTVGLRVGLCVGLQ